MEKRGKVRFWPALGLVLGADVILVLLYTVVLPGFTGRAFSDSLCTSALLLGLATAVPVLLDVGRGIGVGARMGSGEAERRAALEKEHQRREQGLVITFVLAVATFIVTVLSFLTGLL